MNTDRLGREFEEIELALLRDDPTFCRGWKALQRRSALYALAVFSLLAAGAVLLTTGLAIQSAPTWWAGVAALVLSAGVDRGYHRVLAGTASATQTATPSSNAGTTVEAPYR
jgi:hypothetical protein